jgi:hypothetical protein
MIVARTLVVLVTVALMATLAPVAAAQQGVTAPGDFFGHELGADRVLARWDRIVEYFELLETQSDRIQVVNMGPSTQGHPFLLVTISSPENLANLDRLAEISRTLADPRGVDEATIEAMIAEGKAVVSHSLGLHSSEVAGAQAAPEIAYDLLSRDDEETLRILDETVMLLLPNINPDGQIMITDWVRETVGTEYEGAGMPWLYHVYAGHDNNRDGDYMNLVESQYIAKVLYRDWKPQAYVDHHQMGSYGARMYVPPYSEPIRPYADPLMWRELAWYGAHIATKLEEAGMTGILNAGQYPGWGHFGWHWITPFHNIAGMLTESASATLATPLYIHPDQLRGGARGLPEYEAQSNMPSLWPGGWWTVRNIVEQQMVAARALQDHAARNRETVLRGAWIKASRQTERGAVGTPKAYVIPADQHDALTARKMVNTLMLSDIEIWQAGDAFEIGGMTYGAGSFVISLAQPKMGLIRNLLGRTRYPDNTWTRGRDGSPLRPYDSSTHTMSEFMGVRVDPVDGAIEGDFSALDAAIPMAGNIGDGDRFRLDGRLNASYRAASVLLTEGATVRRVTMPRDGLAVGDFIVSGASDALIERLAGTAGVDFESSAVPVGDGMQQMTAPRVGMYQGYDGGNMDEGWTRLLLEQFEFPYTSLMDAEVKAGDLKSRYDTIILPHNSVGSITGDSSGGGFGGRGVERPEQYQSGIGQEGVDALKAFVQAGGTLVTIGQAADLAIDAFDLNVRNVIDNVPSTEFFCPGSTLRMDVDTSHPIAWGMPQEALGLFWQSPAFEITPSAGNHKYSRPVTFVDRDLLQSGWLIGEEHLANKAAVVTAEVGEGQVVLLGIRAQHRAQTDGTFKLLFNALLR